MKRRTMLLAAGAALAAPRIARSQSGKTLKFIPQVDVPLLDPVVNSAYITRNFGFAVFDTLFGQDGAYAAQPQMVETFGADDDGKRWTLVLRDGLRFHDGTPVLARDCVASVARWGKRDAFGQALMAATDELSAKDDKTIVFRLKRPFPLLPAALGKVASSMCPMMPERLAMTDPNVAITEPVGSGPFRYNARERVPGALTVFERFDGYAPRGSGTPDWTAGPKVAYLDRVEWHVIPDASTAAGALASGEMDWWQEPALDLLPVLEPNDDIAVFQLDPTGSPTMLRFNHLQPPFDNPAVRRALLGAVDQSSFMQAVAGDRSDLQQTPIGYFPPASPMAGDAGMSAVPAKPDMARVKAALAAAGYNGERAVVMIATDLPAMTSYGQVGADMLKRAGVNVDVQALDWGSVVQRRASKQPVDKGGWSVFFTSFNGIDQFTPATHLGLRGNGDQAWFGWPTMPEIERMRDAWLQAPGEAEQKAICADIQRRAYEQVPYLPLGSYLQPTATRKSLSGVLRGIPLFWNVKKEG